MESESQGHPRKKDISSPLHYKGLARSGGYFGCQDQLLETMRGWGKGRKQGTHDYFGSKLGERGKFNHSVMEREKKQSRRAYRVRLYLVVEGRHKVIIHKGYIK